MSTPSQKAKCLKFVDELLSAHWDTIETIRKENEGKITLNITANLAEPSRTNVKLSYAAKHSDSREG